MTAKQRAIAAWLHELREITRIQEKPFDPIDVVEAARPEDCVAHDQFTWDDAEAAQERRLDQARRLIRSVRYVETITEVELPARRYVHVSVESSGDKSSRRYEDLDDVKHHPDWAKEVFNAEIKRAIAMVERARAVSDVLGLRDKLEEALAILLEAQQKAA